VYLIEYEVDTLYLDSADLSRRVLIDLSVSGFCCEECGGMFPERTAWIGPKAPAAMQVTWGDLAASPWRWVAARTRTVATNESVDAAARPGNAQVFEVRMDNPEDQDELNLRLGASKAWEDAKKRFPVGQRVRGVVTHHHHFGIFVDLGDELAVGLVQITDFVDEGRMTPEQYPAIGESVATVVLGHANASHKQVWLGMRPSQLDRSRTDR
jgi:hypothetical protein